MTYDPHASADAVPESATDMADGRHAERLVSSFPDPDAIKQQTFTEARHGYDPQEVHEFLVSVTEALHDARGRENELELRIGDLERQLSDAEDRVVTAEHEAVRATEDAEAALAEHHADDHMVTSFDGLDEGELAALVGEETAKVLAAARNAAAGIVANAERTASQMRSKADRDAERLGAEAQALLDHAAREADAEAARRLTEADTAIGLAQAEAERDAARMRAEAEASVAHVEADATRRVDDAQAEADTILDQARHEAKGIIERAGSEGQALVTEAQAVRARMLEDLLRRRKLLRRQVEQLHAGRERLAEAFGVVHESMSVIDTELADVLAEAKAAAEAAAARADSTSDAETDELQAMTDASRAAAGLDATESDDGPVTGSDGPGSAPTALSTGEREPAVTGHHASADAASSLFNRLKGDPTIESATDPDASLDEVAAAVELPPNVEPTGDVRLIAPADLGSPSAAADDSVDDESARPPEDDVSAAAAIHTAELADAAGGDDSSEDGPEIADVVEVVEVVDAPAEIRDPVDAVTPESVASEVDERVMGRVADDQPGRKGSVSVVDPPPVVTDEVLEQRDGLIDDLTRAVVRRMKRLLTDEQNELLDTIRQKRPLPHLDDFLAPEAEHERRYAEAALPALRNAASAARELPGALHDERRSGPGAAATTAKQKGARASVRAPAGGDQVKIIDLAAVLAVDVVGPLRQRLEECMSGSGAESLRAPTAGAGATKAKRSAAADALADEVRLAYREIRNRKVDSSSSTAVREAFARGLRAVPVSDDDRVVKDLLSGL